MKKVLKWVGIVFLVLFVIGLIAGKKEGGNKDSDTSSSKNTDGAKYVLNEKETKVFNAILQDDVSGFLTGGESMLADGLIIANSVEVAKAYEDNQVGADQKYYKKEILVSGKIAAINSGLGNEPYITLNGTNPFLAPQVHFDNPNIDKIANLSKGQRVAFVCTGNGAVVGAPMFKDCQLAEEFVANKVEKIKPEVQEFLNGEKPKFDMVGKLTFVSIAIARFLPENSECYSGGKNCVTEIQKTFKKTSKEDMNKVHTELQQLGLKI